MKRFSLAIGLAGALLLAAMPSARGEDIAPPRPKYGPQAVRLFDARAYIRGHETPDFWALMPYYVSQQNDESCSVACVVMLVNALRAERQLANDEELATQPELLQKTGSRQWAKNVAPGGAGVSLDELGTLTRLAIPLYGVRADVEVVHVDAAAPQATARLRTVLVENEKSGRDLIVANFLQSTLTSDPAGAVGHMAPVAAYDTQADRVLIFDPDRRWYEPYWVALPTLLAAMGTSDQTSGKTRGYIWVRSERVKP